MAERTYKKGIWIIYDGECPLCRSFVHAFHIKKKYGALYLINARQLDDDFLQSEIDRLSLNIDEGMIVYTSGEFYHGRDAVRFLALNCESQNKLWAFLSFILKMNVISSLVYPVMKSVRNIVLRVRGVKKINTKF